MEVLPVPKHFNFGNDKGGTWSLGSSPSAAEVSQLSRRLEAELRAAKSALSCAEVLLPATLLPRVARDALTLADCEPCGARGCTLFIHLEGPASEARKIATVKLDDSTVSTFELHLTLKHEHDLGSWTNVLLQFFKMARGGTIVISPQYTLTKKKLYRSYQQED